MDGIPSLTDVIETYNHQQQEPFLGFYYSSFVVVVVVVLRLLRHDKPLAALIVVEQRKEKTIGERPTFAPFQSALVQRVFQKNKKDQKGWKKDEHEAQKSQEADAHPPSQL